MRGPVARFFGALAVLWLYHAALVREPPADALVPGSPDLEHALVQSRDAFAAGQFEAALEPTLAVIEALPGQDVFLTRLAHIYRGMDRAADEAGAWEAVVEVSPIPGDACPMLPEAYQRLGDAPAALRAFERCVEFEPKNPDSLLFLGQAYLRAGRTADARAVLERGLAYARGYADYYLVLGVLEFSAGDVARARGYFERFAELAPLRREEVAVWLQRTSASS